METIKNGCHKPWIIMGDFNSILNMEDRVGGSPVSVSEVVNFQIYLEICEMLELPSKENRFTWSEKQGENRNFFLRLIGLYE